MPHLLLGAHAVQPSFAAGLALIVVDLLVERGLTCPTASSVISAVGASRSRAYAAKARLADAVGQLERGPGRPPAAPKRPPPAASAVTTAVVDFLMRNPGAVHRSDERTRYTDAFRAFALELVARHDTLDLDVIAEALQVPLGTLKGWQHPGDSDPDEPEPSEPVSGLTESRIASVLAAWTSWRGDFVPFCDHVRLHLRIPFGRSLIRRILRGAGVRIPRRRRGRSPDEEALRGQFETFFPGFQWVGDGTPLAVQIAGETCTFNLELMVDADSGALTGVSIRDTEDAAAVVEAFDDGVTTTGQPPKALLLDNRPSNHTDEVVDALGDAAKISATPRRPQNKAHVEGAFGLFSQTAPELRLDSLQPKDIAREVLGLVVTTWARTLNHRPRDDRGGKSRVQLYTEAEPTDEQIAAANQHLQALIARQERALETRRARLDPDLRALLDAAFERLGLDDAERRFRDAIARYPLDAITAGIAIFEGKAKAGTLPEGVDARYLLGIIRNVSDEEEGVAIARELFDRRIELRDIALARLQREREALARRAEDTLSSLLQLADRVTAADRFIDRDFWLRATADLIRERPTADRRRHFLIAARRIHACHSRPKRDRNAAVRRLAALVVPIA